MPSRTADRLGRGDLHPGPRRVCAIRQRVYQTAPTSRNGFSAAMERWIPAKECYPAPFEDDYFVRGSMIDMVIPARESIGGRARLRASNIAPFLGRALCRLICRLEKVVGDQAKSGGSVGESLCQTSCKDHKENGLTGPRYLMRLKTRLKTTPRRRSGGWS